MQELAFGDYELEWVKLKTPSRGIKLAEKFKPGVWELRSAGGLLARFTRNGPWTVECETAGDTYTFGLVDRGSNHPVWIRIGSQDVAIFEPRSPRGFFGIKGRNEVQFNEGARYFLDAKTGLLATNLAKSWTVASAGGELVESYDSKTGRLHIARSQAPPSDLKVLTMLGVYLSYLYKDINIAAYYQRVIAHRPL